jgi:hypothetical protein
MDIAMLIMKAVNVIRYYQPYRLHSANVLTTPDSRASSKIYLS